LHPPRRGEAPPVGQAARALLGLGALGACVAVVASGAASAGSAEASFNVYTVAFSDETHGLITAAYAPKPCPSGFCPFFVQATGDGGRHWSTTLRASVSSAYHGIVATVPGSTAAWAYFPCFESGCRSSLFRSFDRGRRWRLLSRPDLVAISFSSPREGWAVSGRSVLVTTHDGGRSWRPVAKQPCSASLNAQQLVAAASSARGWALCSDAAFTEPAVALYESRNGGRSWQLRGRHGPGLRQVGRGFAQAFALRGLSFRGSGRGWIWRYAGRPITSAGDGRPWHTTPGWPFSTTTMAVAAGALIGDEQAYVVIGTHGPTLLARTSNGGGSWTVVHRWPR
jgi:hypothetical protein